jgi:Tfp pilus assembly protein PilF
MRKPPAKKEEALFWMSKASELAGRREEAKAGYRELIDHYHGFWVPEALYTYILLEREDGKRALTQPYAQRLREEYPNNRWTQKLDELK